MNDMVRLNAATLTSDVRTANVITTREAGTRKGTYRYGD